MVKLIHHLDYILYVQVFHNQMKHLKHEIIQIMVFPTMN